jgi:hypothetical protein
MKSIFSVNQQQRQLKAKTLAVLYVNYLYAHERSAEFHKVES